MDLRDASASKNKPGHPMHVAKRVQRSRITAVSLPENVFLATSKSVPHSKEFVVN